MSLHGSGRARHRHRDRGAWHCRPVRIRQTRAGLDLANAVLGVLTIAVPTVLIGVCKGAMMRCHMVTLPTLIVLGVLLAVLAAIAAYLDLKPAKRA